MKPMAATLVEVEYWPDTAARLHRLASLPWFVFLDSCRHAGHAGRYDIVAWEPDTTLTTRGALTTIADAAQRTGSLDDPFALVDRLLGREDAPGDLPFTGGPIGLFAYDLARRLESADLGAARHRFSRHGRRPVCACPGGRSPGVPRLVRASWGGGGYGGSRSRAPRSAAHAHPGGPRHQFRRDFERTPGPRLRALRGCLCPHQALHPRR